MSDLNVDPLRNNAPLVLVLDPEGRIVLWRHACTELTGYTFEEARGKYVWDLLVAPDRVEYTRDVFYRIIAGELSCPIEERCVTKAGELRWIEWSYDLIRRPDGMIEFVSVIGVERTAAKRAEEALRVSEAKFAGIISIASDAIISIDEEQRISIYNEGAERIFGWTRDKVLGKPIDMLIPERFRAVHREHVRRFAREPVKARKVGGGRREVIGLRKNGEEFPGDATVSKLHLDDVRLYTVVLRDITAQKIIERDQRFLADVGAALATSLDHDETLTKIAQLAVRELADCCMIKLVEDDGTLRNWKVVHADPAKADLAWRIEQLKLDAAGPHFASTALATKHTAVVSPVPPGHLESMVQDDQHLQILREIHATSYVALPLIAHERLLGALVLVRSESMRPYDADEIRLAEDLAYRAAHSIDSARLYKLSQQAIRARDEVLGVVAHDLRNPIHTAMLAADGLVRPEPDEERRQTASKLAEVIRRSLDRANRLIQDLLEVSCIEAGRLALELAPVSSHGLVRDAVESFVPTAAAHSLAIETSVGRSLPPVIADSERLARVFSNLLDNASKFTPPGGRVQVGAEPHGGEVCFWVRDTGRGIRQQEAQHVFDRFSQTGPTDRRGAGLGLSIAKGIIEAHRGRIWVESAPGQGSTFYFTLPVAAEKPHRMGSAVK
jgi:PAS domain S-box-containing protein